MTNFITPRGNEISNLPETLLKALTDEALTIGNKKPLPSDRPLYQLVSVSVDIIIPKREIFCAELASYLNSDLLAYQAKTPSELTHAQREEWEPVLRWFKERFGFPLKVHYDLSPLSQERVLIEHIQQHLLNYTPLILAGISGLCQLSSSLVIALAFLEGNLSLEETFTKINLEEETQNKKWGKDPEAEKRQQSILRDLKRVEQYLTHLGYPFSKAL